MADASTSGWPSHQATDHFVKYISGEVIPRPESCERAFYETLD